MKSTAVLQSLTVCIALLSGCEHDERPSAPAPAPANRNLTDALIVKYLSDPSCEELEAAVRIAQGVAARRGIVLSYLRSGALDVHVFKLDRTYPLDEVSQLAAALKASDPTIEYAVPSVRMYPTSDMEPNLTHGDSTVATNQCCQFRSAFTIKDRFAQPADVFIAGEPITLEMQVRNVSAWPQTMPSLDRCDPVVFTVSDRSGQTGWASLDGRACGAGGSSFPFAPGETKVFAAEWRQQVRGGALAREGPYTAHATDRVNCEMHHSAGFTIQ
jgi:hypothetical protein